MHVEHGLPLPLVILWLALLVAVDTIWQSAALTYPQYIPYPGPESARWNAVIPPIVDFTVSTVIVALVHKALNSMFKN